MLGIGAGELVALLVIGLLVLGPDRLPKYAAEAGRFLHQVRQMARKAREDVRSSLEPELRELGIDRNDVAAWFGEEADTLDKSVSRWEKQVPDAARAKPPSYPDAT